MTIGEATAKRILYFCNKKKITVNKLSIICGITQSTLNNIINGQSKNPTISTIKKICDGLEISLWEFFDCTEFMELEQEIK